jgi:ABC-2 type transport system ATP-binding protein
MIIIEYLQVSYQSKIFVIDNLNLSLTDKTVHGLIGLNGSGKTTLLNTIFGILKPDNGNITYNNQKISKKDIAYLESENYFYPNITGDEYLKLFENNSFKLNEWNSIFELPLNMLIENYSTGMRKKLALLGVLKLNKPIIILDEPFNGLDMEATKILQLIILKLKEEGKTLIVTSHILESLTNICDEIHYLKDKNIKFSRYKNNFDGIEQEIFENFHKSILITNI